jgi:hypothetical protein
MSTQDAIRQALRELAALSTGEPSLAESSIERIESVLRAALCADEDRIGSHAGLGLAPERAGQPRFYTATGPVPAAGHWYSPAAVRELLAAERERWQRIAANAQAMTTGCVDKLDYFEVPSHLMAALALALDEGPNE